MPTTREQARDMAAAHDEGLHDDLPREDCPECEGRELRSYPPAPKADRLGNTIAREGYDRCDCGCKYWEHDRCIDCGTHVSRISQEVHSYDRMPPSKLCSVCGQPRFAAIHKEVA